MMIRIFLCVSPLFILDLYQGFGQSESRPKVEIIELAPYLEQAPLDLSREAGRPIEPERFIFLDRKSGEIVVAYPENFGTPDFEKKPGPVHRERILLAINIRPSLQVSLSEDSQGLFTYDYTVTNGPGARQELAHWVLAPPTLEGLRAIRNPLGWGNSRFEVPDERVEDSIGVMSILGGATQRARMESGLVRHQIRWHARSERVAIHPKSSLGQFQVTSTHFPGLILAYLQGFPYKPMSPTGILPWELSKHLPAFNFIETNSISLATLGPCYSPKMSRLEIARDFSAQIQRLFAEDRISQSPLLQSLFSTLSAYSEGQTTDSAELVVQLNQLAGTAGAFEGEILQAIRVSIAAAKD